MFSIKNYYVYTSKYSIQLLHKTGLSKNLYLVKTNKGQWVNVKALKDNEIRLIFSDNPTLKPITTAEEALSILLKGKPHASQNTYSI